MNPRPFFGGWRGFLDLLRSVLTFVLLILLLLFALAYWIHSPSDSDPVANSKYTLFSISMDGTIIFILL